MIQMRHASLMEVRAHANAIQYIPKSLYKSLSLYKNAKDPILSISRSPWRPEKSCVFAATVLDPSDIQRQTRTGRPFSVLYRTRPAAFLLFVRIPAG